MTSVSTKVLIFEMTNTIADLAAAAGASAKARRPERQKIQREGIELYKYQKDMEAKELLKHVNSMVGLTAISCAPF